MGGSLVYTEESLQRDGYAGVPTTRISELTHGYQFDPLAPRTKGEGRPAANPVAGLSSAPLVRTGKRVIRDRSALDGPNVAGIPSATYNSRQYAQRFTVKKEIGSTKLDGAEIKACVNWCGGKDHGTARRPGGGEFRRRLATPSEEIHSFRKAYIISNPVTRRTEIMTTRRPGAAHLDIDLKNFDPYASHASHMPEGPAIKDSLGSDMLPVHSVTPRCGKHLDVALKQCDKLVMANGFLTASGEDTRSKQDLGYMRRKLDNEWSRSNFSCFKLEEGYDQMHWRIPPVKPLINVTLFPEPFVNCNSAKTPAPEKAEPSAAPSEAPPKAAPSAGPSATPPSAGPPAEPCRATHAEEIPPNIMQSSNPPMIPQPS